MLAMDSTSKNIFILLLTITSSLFADTLFLKWTKPLVFSSCLEKNFFFLKWKKTKWHLIVQTKNIRDIFNILIQT